MMNNFKKRTKGSIRNRMKRFEVDINNRLGRSFGNKVNQNVEIHYRGKPFSFVYDGNIETVSIDVVKSDLGLKDEDIQFDTTKERMDEADAFIGCTCGAKFDIKVPITICNNHELVMKKAVETMPNLLNHDNKKEGHTLSLLYIQTSTQTVPEKERIKNFNPDRINYYRIFSKKTVEVKYLVTYGQDLISEAPQYKYSETTGGSKNIGFQNVLFMIFIFGLIETFTFLFVSSSSPSYFPTTHPSYTPWYILIGVVIIMFSTMWRLHIHDVSKSTTKLIMLQSAPFFISNRGVLPVVLHNSQLQDVWDYQARLMEMDDSKAKDVIYALQTWSDAQIAQLERMNKLGQVEHELTMINEEIRDISKLDHEYRKETTARGSYLKDVALSVAITALAYTFVMYIIGVF